MPADEVYETLADLLPAGPYVEPKPEPDEPIMMPYPGSYLQKAEAIMQTYRLECERLEETINKDPDETYYMGGMTPRLMGLYQQAAVLMQMARMSMAFYQPMVSHAAGATLPASHHGVINPNHPSVQNGMVGMDSVQWTFVAAEEPAEDEDEELG